MKLSELKWILLRERGGVDREFKMMVIHSPKIDPHTYLGSFLGISLSGNAQWAYIFWNFLTVISGILGFMPCQCTYVAQAD